MISSENTSSLLLISFVSVYSHTQNNIKEEEVNPFSMQNITSRLLEDILINKLIFYAEY